MNKLKIIVDSGRVWLETDKGPVRVDALRGHIFDVIEISEIVKVVTAKNLIYTT